MTYIQPFFPMANVYNKVFVLIMVVDSRFVKEQGANNGRKKCLIIKLQGKVKLTWHAHTSYQRNWNNVLFRRKW